MDFKWLALVHPAKEPGQQFLEVVNAAIAGVWVKCGQEDQ
jgi:hypothetical protein